MLSSKAQQLSINHRHVNSGSTKRRELSYMGEKSVAVLPARNWSGNMISVKFVIDIPSWTKCAKMMLWFMALVSNGCLFDTEQVFSDSSGRADDRTQTSSNSTLLNPESASTVRNPALLHFQADSHCEVVGILEFGRFQCIQDSENRSTIEVLVESGESVKKDQLLVRVENKKLDYEVIRIRQQLERCQQEIQRARIQHEQDRLVLERSRSLRDIVSLEEIEIDEAASVASEFEVQISSLICDGMLSQLHFANIERERADLRSPFDGVVASVKAKPGVQSSMVCVADQSMARLSFLVDEATAYTISPHNQIHWYYDDAPKTVYTALPDAELIIIDARHGLVHLSATTHGVAPRAGGAQVRVRLPYCSAPDLRIASALWDGTSASSDI